MVNKKVSTIAGIIIIAAIALTFGGIILFGDDGSDTIGGPGEPPINPIHYEACTQEAKLCPDGSSVGRTGPNCEFAECPAAKAIDLGFGSKMSQEDINKIKKDDSFPWYTIPELDIKFKVTEDTKEDLRYYIKEENGKYSKEYTSPVFFYSDSESGFKYESCFENDLISDTCSKGYLSRVALNSEKDSVDFCKKKSVSEIGNDVICFVGPPSPVLFGEDLEEYHKEVKGKKFGIYLNTIEPLEKDSNNWKLYINEDIGFSIKIPYEYYFFNPYSQSPKDPENLTTAIFHNGEHAKLSIKTEKSTGIFGDKEVSCVDNIEKLGLGLKREDGLKLIGESILGGEPAYKYAGKNVYSLAHAADAPNIIEISKCHNDLLYKLSFYEEGDSLGKLNEDILSTFSFTK